MCVHACMQLCACACVCEYGCKHNHVSVCQAFLTQESDHRGDVCLTAVQTHAHTVATPIINDIHYIHIPIHLHDCLSCSAHASSGTTSLSTVVRKWVGS